MLNCARFRLFRCHCIPSTSYLRTVNISTWHIFDITRNLASVMISLRGFYKERSQKSLFEFNQLWTRRRHGDTYHYFAVDVASDLKCLVRSSLLGQLLVQVVEKARRCFRQDTRLCLITVVACLIVCAWTERRTSKVRNDIEEVWASTHDKQVRKIK